MKFSLALLLIALLSTSALKTAERYIATNRFHVRESADPKFEKRWADRKSSLATLNGFKFFTLLRQIDPTSNNDDDSQYSDTFGNYVSCTVWENEDCFQEWRTGSAFKEAHGGGKLSGFVGLLKTALFILKGGPKPAFYESFDITTPPPDNVVPHLVAGGSGGEGWRDILANGEDLITPDVFCVIEKFKIKPDQEENVELYISSGSGSDGDGSDSDSGLIFSSVMRRDGMSADDGYVYNTIKFYRTKYDMLISCSGSGGGSSSGGSSSSSSSSGGGLADYIEETDVCYYAGKLSMVSPTGA